MAKLDKDKRFSAGTADWRFELHLEGRTDEPRYRVCLFQSLPAGPEELVLTNEYHGASARLHGERPVVRAICCGSAEADRERPRSFLTPLEGREGQL